MSDAGGPTSGQYPYPPQEPNAQLPYQPPTTPPSYPSAGSAYPSQPPNYQNPPTMQGYGQPPQYSGQPAWPASGAQPQGGTNSSGNLFARFNRLPVFGKIGVGCGSLIVLCLVCSMGIAVINAMGGNKSATTGDTNATVAQSKATNTPSGPVATQAPTATHAPTATSTPTLPHFGDGSFQVGKDIQPGTYRTRVGSSGCYYERLKGFGGTIGDIIANENTDAPAIVTIAATDKGFTSQNCGTWTENLSQITQSKTTFEDGEYIIGTDITPGTYKNTGEQGCYYARLKGFGGTIGDIIANNNVDAVTIVTIAASDKGFLSHGCGTWTKQ